MKNSYPRYEDSYNAETEAFELENLLSRFSERSNEAASSASVGAPRLNTILNSLTAALSSALRSLKVHKYARPFAQYKYIPLSLHILSTIKHPLRFRPRAVVFFSLVILIWTPVILLALVLAYGGIPPDYSVVKMRERELPQHVWARAEVMGPSGKLGRRGEMNDTVDDGRRYLRFPDHLWGHGLNNVLQEVLLTSHLAHRAQRSFVFEDFTWSHLPLPYTLYDFALRPTRIPLGAFVGGWVTGGGVGGSSERHGVVEEHGSGARTGSTPMLRQGDASDGDDDGDDVSGWTHSVNSTSSTTTTIATSARAAIEERRAVSAEYFEYVCSPGRRIEIWYGKDVPPAVNLDHSPSSQGNSGSVDARAISTLPLLGHDASGNEIVDWWIRRLQQPDVLDEPCVVIREEEQRVFDSNFFGSTRILSLFDDLKRSPVLRGFTWSPLVQHALQKTLSRFFSGNVTSPLARTGSGTVQPPISHTPSTSDPGFPLTPIPPPSLSLPPIIPGLLAVHLRRGDYKRHCLRLAEWRAGYMGFNRFDGMLDTFDAEEHLRGRCNTTDTLADDDEDLQRTLPPDECRKAYYLAHCLPTIQQIVQRLHDVREEYQHSLDTEHGQGTSRKNALHDVYILTNGWPAFVYELKVALLADGWGRVMATPELVDASAIDATAPLPGARENEQNILASRRRTRRDIVDALSTEAASGLTREEKGVSVALDMGFAERAEVFVGNGFSSLSSNIVMLRMAKGMPMCSSRLL